MQLPEKLRNGKIKLNFTLSPTMSEHAATIFLYEFFTMLSSSDIIFDTLQITNVPQRELIVDLYQVFMRVKTLALNGRDSVLSFPRVQEAYFKGELITGFLAKEIRLKGVGLNLHTQNLFRNIEKVTIIETRQPQAACADFLSKVEHLTTDDPELLACACKVSKKLQRVTFQKNSVKLQVVQEVTQHKELTELRTTCDLACLVKVLGLNHFSHVTHAIIKPFKLCQCFGKFAI